MFLTDTILLIEPIGFGFNIETATDNKFQNNKFTENIRLQFENFKLALVNEGLSVKTFAPTDEKTPDALFPNNWISTFPDKSMIIYPMLAPNRRLEKRTSFIEKIKQYYSKVTDLSFLENSDSFLEGTGSLAIDHEQKIAYACLSKRTTAIALENWRKLTGYEVIEFVATDENEFPIYHTNVILTLAESFAIICSESIIPSDRKRVETHLQNTGRDLIQISFDQAKKFCGNCLALKSKNNEQLIVMSDQAKSAFTSEQLLRIKKSAKIISSNLSEIETIGGGGARCMIAELF